MVPASTASPSTPGRGLQAGLAQNPPADSPGYGCDPGWRGASWIVVPSAARVACEGENRRIHQARQAIRLSAQVLPEQRRSVAVENPGYCAAYRLAADRQNRHRTTTSTLRLAQRTAHGGYCRLPPGFRRSRRSQHQYVPPGVHPMLAGAWSCWRAERADGSGGVEDDHCRRGIAGIACWRRWLRWIDR